MVNNEYVNDLNPGNPLGASKFIDLMNLNERLSFDSKFIKDI